ncbi:hypothetical protein ACHAW5_004437 [Stephanodiscus triporus]|uniref:Nucleolar protein 14 n=1 Tax=Stephanodiscus triporus TaxID=2934178 RepID=A0ABD3Q834_9STRA
MGKGGGGGRSKNKTRRSTGTLPRGIPHRGGVGGRGGSVVNPFDYARTKNSASRVKHPVHNKLVPGAHRGGSAAGDNAKLAESMARRREHLSRRIADSGKANTFVDRRIGEAAAAARSNDHDGHDGPDFDSENTRERGAYGGGGDEGGGTDDMGRAYRSRREELEDRIRMKKMAKAERMKRKEDQAETFETMDESFAELSRLLNFRDKEQERVQKREARMRGELSQEEKEMDDWDKEMKTYLFERKVKATDRTKTPEEIAKARADELHAMESKRLARMAGDFLSEDEFSDISDDDGGGRRGGKKRKRHGGDKGGGKSTTKKMGGGGYSNPEEMDEDDDDENGMKEKKRGVRFTADGLMYVDEHDNVIGKVGEEEEEKDDDDGEESEEESDDGSSDEARGHRDLGGSEDEASAVASSSDEDDGDDESVQDAVVEYKEGMAVQGNYHADEQYGKRATWYNGTITSIRQDDDGKFVYDVAYEDGDFEEGMKAENVRSRPLSKKEKAAEKEKLTEIEIAKKKKLKAKLRAKASIPFVFEVPTTLDALHDLIAEYASTGADASLIIQRVHATNSVRLNHKNKERMQNYYDVLLRRFVAVGDAIFESGNGGTDLERYEQLNSLTKTLYVMSQDSPECAAAVWSRRLGIFQKALSKRLRDVEINPLGDACRDEFTAWPSTGMLLLMRALPHIFPSTDRRHTVITPALLLLGQILAQTPIKTPYDVVMGLFCAGLMLEYTKGAKRIPPEATAFLASVLRLFADDFDSALADSPLPSLGNASKSPQLAGFRNSISKLSDCNADDVRFSLEKADIQSDTCSLAILNTTLHLTHQAFDIIGKSEDGSEREIFGEITKSLLLITGKRKDLPMPQFARSRIAETARAASSICASNAPRQTIQRRKAATVKELAIKTMAPRMEDPSRYSMSKDKGKSQLKAEHDRNRREYKREHKAAMRELRLDSSFIESERRKAKSKTDNSARDKRHKNFAWLETEQATMNQQVRMGGGLLSGGGIGAAKAKARSGKMGIKKGGKF